MPKSVRFCIQCGRQIDEAYYCTNPDCEGIPNFYRNVAGPELDAEAPARGHSPAGDVRTPPAPEATRETIAIDAEPLAVLINTSDGHDQQAVFAGKNEVGALKSSRIVVDKPEVSSAHARIICGRGNGGGWRFAVIDLDSTNGTFVNGERVSKKELLDGDRVAFADSEFTFRVRLEEQGPRVTIPLD